MRKLLTFIVAILTTLYAVADVQRVPSEDNKVFQANRMWPAKASGSIPWSPSLISTRAWYDAADASTIHTNDAYGKVRQWEDKSGNTNHLVQTTGTKQPSIAANTVTLDGIDDCLLITGKSFGITTDLSVMGVVKQITYGSNEGFFSLIPNPSTGADYNNSSAVVWYQGVGSGQFGVMQYWGSANLFNVVHTGVPFGVNFLFSAGRGSGTGYLGVYGNTPVTDTYGFTPTAPSGLILGARWISGAPAAYGNVAFNELVLLSDKASTETRQKIEGYLAWKWGLQGNLPADHPYKDSPPKK